MKFSTKIRTFAILSVLTLSQIGAVISHGNTIDLTARNPQALSTFDHMSASASDTIRFVITNKSDSGISGAFNMVAHDFRKTFLSYMIKIPYAIVIKNLQTVSN